MIDVHCHLNFHTFDRDYDEVIKEAQSAGVKIIVNVGTKIDSSKRAVELAEKYNNLYAIVGVHPHHADKIELGKDWVDQLEQIARHPKVIGIGECGLDYYRYKSNEIVDPKLQKEVFIKQIELSHKLKLPLQIHNRLAWNDVHDILINHKSYLLNPPGMFHCFSGTVEFLHNVLDLGFYVGFDGNITYPGIPPGENTSLQDLVKFAPVDRILVETDSPFLTPVPIRGQRNTPANIPLILEFIAKAKKISYNEASETVLNNSQVLFGVKSV